MGKDNKGKELGTHFYQRKDGRYEAMATINGVKISIYGRNLRELRKQFEEQKELAENRIEARRKRITLNEWFEGWFVTYKIPNFFKNVHTYTVKEFEKYILKDKLGC